MNRSASLSVLFAGCLAGTGVQAVDTPLDDAPFFDDLPIVASVSRLPQRQTDLPASVTIIDREMIQASGMRTVEDLLRLVPGFQVSSHNQDPAIVNYHGLTSGMAGNEFGVRVQVLIDGRSQYSPLFKGGVNWNLLPVALADIERIEVTRGTNTVSYGSNAFLGVVNIITVDPTLAKGWLLSGNSGKNAIHDLTLRWAGQASDDTNVRFTYHELEDNGFQRGYYAGQWVSAPDNRQTRLFDLVADKQLSGTDELRFSLSQAQDVSQYGRPDKPTTDPIRDYSQQSTALGLRWRRVLSSEEELSLRYSYVNDWASGAFRTTGTFTGGATVAGVMPDALDLDYDYIYDPGGRSTVHELEFSHQLSPFEHARLSWGAMAKVSTLTSEGMFSTAAQMHRENYRIFGNLEYRPHTDWIFNLGSSLEQDRLNDGLFDYRAGVNYKPSPSSSLRFVVSRAHRTVSLFENQGVIRYAGNVPGNPTPYYNTIYYSNGVNAERVDSVELGYFAESKAWRTSLDVRAFIEKIPNLIQIVPLALPMAAADDQERSSERTLSTLMAQYLYGRADGAYNLEHVEIRGHEYQMRWQPFAGTRLIFSNAITSVHSDFNNAGVITDTVGVNIDKVVNQTRMSVPHYSRSAMWIQQLPLNLQASVLYFRAGQMRFRRNNTIEPAERFDVRLAWPFRFGATRGEFAYTAQMINDAQQGRYNSRLADRVHWLSFRLAF